MSRALKLTFDDIAILDGAIGMAHCGGITPCWVYSTYLRCEKLRRHGLLKFWSRRSRRWDWNAYDITPKGEAARKNFFGPHR